MTVPSLSPVEARVLAVLVEKQRSVPDTYPMSLNALVAGCNQKTSRAPTMNVSDADVLQALDVLNGFSLIVETSGGRVMRYAHNAERVLALPTQSVALLSTLVLRGPQTAGELRHQQRATAPLQRYLRSRRISARTRGARRRLAGGRASAGARHA